MKKSANKKVFIFIGVIVVLAIIVVSNLKKSGPKVTVQTEKVKRGRIVATVSGSARIQPEVQVKISAKVSGQIMDLAVEEGDYVQKGQFLVQLDPVAYRAAVDQSQSNLDYAEAGYKKAESEYERAQALFENNHSSKAELEIAKSTYEQSKAQVEQSRASLEQAKDNLEKTTIYAPMAGTVSQLNKKAGEMAMGSQFTLDVIMIVADLTKMRAETEIDENDIVAVTLGDSANIEVDAFPDSVFKGIVTEIANTGTTQGQGTQAEVTNFLVKVAMVDPPARLRPGMSATVDVITETRQNALSIPIQCLTVRAPLTEKSESADSTQAMPATGSEENIQVVFRIEDGVAKQVPVTVGISSERDYEVIEGLEEGQEIVSGSYRVLSKELKDGTAVTVDNKAVKIGDETN
ncbi:efflux RND transporter periplasmic adaptor subunit [bacterium]|nr:efflux RND transporter periplasmic adaptor subunit [bacterium]